jgi:hypothetical protein
METTELNKMNKTSISIASGFEEANDRDYWHYKSPLQRLEALELMRQIIYGYNPSSDRLQRVLTIIERA